MENCIISTWPLWAIILLGIVIIWSLIWKGIALWRSAQKGDRTWFIILLVVNTFALLEIIYYFYFSQKKAKETDKQNQDLTK